MKAGGSCDEYWCLPFFFCFHRTDLSPWEYRDSLNTSPSRFHQSSWLFLLCNDEVTVFSLFIQEYDLQIIITCCYNIVIIKEYFEEICLKRHTLFTFYIFLHHCYCKRNYVYSRCLQVKMTTSISIFFKRWTFTSYLTQLHKVYHSL